MNLFDLEAQYQFYLNVAGLEESRMAPNQARETKRAFMGACGQILNLLTDGLNDVTEEAAMPKIESLFVQVYAFWEAEAANHPFVTDTDVIVVENQPKINFPEFYQRIEDHQIKQTD